MRMLFAPLTRPREGGTRQAGTTQGSCRCVAGMPATAAPTCMIRIHRIWIEGGYICRIRIHRIWWPTIASLQVVEVVVCALLLTTTTPSPTHTHRGKRFGPRFGRLRIRLGELIGRSRRGAAVGAAAAAGANAAARVTCRRARSWFPALMPRRAALPAGTPACKTCVWPHIMARSAEAASRPWEAASRPVGGPLRGQAPCITIMHQGASFATRAPTGVGARP